MRGLPIRYLCFVKAPLWISRFDPVLVVTVLTLWVGVLPQVIVPTRQYNDAPTAWTNIPIRGTFVSVAERLLAGDTLYRGVYDNKEPLFYYFVAAQRAIGSWAELAAEAILIVVACFWIGLGLNRGRIGILSRSAPTEHRL